MYAPKVVTVTRARRPLHRRCARTASADMLADVQAAYGGGFFWRLRAVAAAFRSSSTRACSWSTVMSKKP